MRINTLLINCILGICLSKMSLHRPYFTSAKSIPAFEDYVATIFARKTCIWQDKEQLRDILLEYYTQPLDLNTIPIQDLQALSILSSQQIDAFIAYMRKKGSLHDLDELQAIPSFDPETIHLLLPFVVVHPHKSPPSCSKKNTCSKTGHQLTMYYATNNHAYNKTVINNRHNIGTLDQCHWYFLMNKAPYKYGITAHKCPGESFTLDPLTHRYGFNLWTFFFSLSNKTWLKKLLIGDYHIGFGQGLIFGIPTRKNYEVHAIMGRSHYGIKAYQGIARTGLRGMALATALKCTESTLFHANQYLDAKIERQGPWPYARSIDQTGRYDNLSKLAKKGQLHQQVVGHTILVKDEKHKNVIGLNTCYSYYHIPVIPLQKPWRSYLFHGQHRLHHSLFYHAQWKALQTFGELACAWLNFNRRQPSYAYIAGTLLEWPAPISLLATLYRYSPSFHALYGSGFKQYTSEQSNEYGLYGSIKITPRFNLQLYSHIHYFATLRPKHHLSQPSHGYGMAHYINYIHQRKTIVRVENKLTQLPQPSPAKINPPVMIKRCTPSLNITSNSK